MSEPKTRCSDCGVAILQRTADTHDGRCVPCHREVAAIPPQDFELPSKLTERLVALNRNPADFRQMCWQDGADFVHRFIDKLEEQNELYQKWLPRLRAFAEKCRTSRPLPNDNPLSSCDREKQRIYESTLERFRFLEKFRLGWDAAVAICQMPLVAMPIAQRLWVRDDERTVLLTPEEVSRWNEIYSHPDGALWWFVHFWWNVDDSREQELPLSERWQRWSDDDVPNGETPWPLTVGYSYGPLAGAEWQELWSWNGIRAKFVKNLGTRIS